MSKNLKGLKAPARSSSKQSLELIKPARHPQARSSGPQPLAWTTVSLVSILRMLILGIGSAAIAGTILAILYPQSQKVPVAHLTSPLTVQSLLTGQLSLSPSRPTAKASTPPQLSWLQQQLQKGQEMTGVKTQIQKLVAAQSGLTASMFFLNPQTGDYLDIAGSESISAASTIKLPILIACFQAVDAGILQLDEQLVMRQDLVAPEAGSMQYKPVGTKFSALETAELMISISDNTATNMLIDRLGGNTKLNLRFRAWGLKHTVIRNPLPDLEGTNTISPQDLALLMLRLNQGELLSSKSRKQALAILQTTVTNTLLPQGLEKGATIAHKTGDIGSIIGDAGLIEMPNGQQYAATVMVKRPYNDVRARTLIQNISRLTYQHYSKTPKPATTTSSPQSN